MKYRGTSAQLLGQIQPIYDEFRNLNDMLTIKEDMMRDYDEFAALDKNKDKKNQKGFWATFGILVVSLIPLISMHVLSVGWLADIFEWSEKGKIEFRGVSLVMTALIWLLLVHEYLVKTWVYWEMDEYFPSNMLEILEGLGKDINQDYWYTREKVEAHYLGKALPEGVHINENYRLVSPPMYSLVSRLKGGLQSPVETELESGEVSLIHTVINTTRDIKDTL